MDAMESRPVLVAALMLSITLISSTPYLYLDALITLMVERGASPGRRELTNASLSSLSWMIQFPPSVAFLKKNNPMPPWRSNNR